MISLLLALTLGQTQAAPVEQGAPATLQYCEMTPAGWVCNYRMPAVILRGVPAESVVLHDPAAVSLPAPPIVAAPPPSAVSTAEADRQARLIARCADASWLSLCLPGDRREARVLRDAANARAALRAEVTQLLSEDRCVEAQRTALAGGDMTLAWEVRNFCAPVPSTAAADAAPN